MFEDGRRKTHLKQIIKNFLNKKFILINEPFPWGNYLMGEKNLTFEDGVLLCKHIYQCAIHKTLNGVPEQWDIFYKTHEMLEKLDQKFSNERLYEVLYELNMDDIYAKM